MVRKVGFGDDGDPGDTAAPPPVTEQATADRPTGAAGPARNPWKKIAVPIMLVPMAGIGIAILFRTLASGEWVGAAFAMIWSILVINILIKRLLGLIFDLPARRR